MSSEFNKRHLANMLYSVPRIVDATNLSVVSNDLMMAFLWYRSDTTESLSNFVNFEYGKIDNHSLSSTDDRDYRHRIFPTFGLKFRNRDIFIVDVLEKLLETRIPIKGRSKVSTEEWQDVLKAAIFILRTLEAYEQKVYRTQGMTVQNRAVTYRLYAASQIVDEDNLAVLASNILVEFPDLKSIDYRRITKDNWGIYGLKLKNKSILLSMLFNEFWDTQPPEQVLEAYPFLIERGNPRHLPPEFPERIGYTYDNMECPMFWEMIMFLTCTILESFERVVPIKNQI